MSKSNETIAKTVGVVVGLCLVCSLIVSVAAVGLKPKQIENKQLDTQRNILAAAGLDQHQGSVADVYAQYIDAAVVDLGTGQLVPGKDGNLFDQRVAAKDPSRSTLLDPEQDLAGLKRRADQANVYFAKNDQGQLDAIILPMHGRGLWSTMYAFVAIDPSATEIKGLVYYDQGETPGLGGEVANPNWQALWQGKKLFDEQGKPAIQLVKGGANPSSPNFEHQVDGLSGATLTANGVQATFDFWLSEQGFGPFLKHVRAGGLHNG